jgi:hypothetical protein
MTVAPTADRGGKRRGERAGPLPNFFIIGAMRSGTTALSRYLGAHPEVFMAPEKEVHFFDRHHDRGLDWYRSRFAGAGDRPAVGEATQTYLYLPDVPARIAAVVPHGRLIAILRNPVGRAYSHYWMNRSLGTETEDFAEAVAHDPREAPAKNGPFPYLDRGRYLPQLQRVCEHFPREALHVLLLEDLIAAPGDTFGAVCAFLGIDSGVRPENLGTAINRHLEIRSIRVRDLGRRLPRPLGRVVGRLNTKPVTYPPMDPGVRRELVAKMVGDNARLAAWLGRDLSVWDR